jgi:predicted dehydrogenase
MSTDARLGAVVVGAGYWGPNLARNFQASADWRLVAICDQDRERAAKIAAT